MNFDILKEQFENVDLTNDRIREEFLLIEIVSSEFEKDTDDTWQSLSETEKRNKRIFYSKAAKKTKGYVDGFFRYEESVIDLYESICTTLDKLRNLGNKNNYVIRLIVFLELEKYIINLHRDTRMIKSLYFSIANNLIYDCLNSEHESFFLHETNLLYLESKFHICNLLWEARSTNFC